MVDVSDFLGPDEYAPEDVAEDTLGEGDVSADLVALKACLQALADAIASTNLAVINGAQGDLQAATQRVQTSIGALKRFHDAFKILDAGEEEPDED